MRKLGIPDAQKSERLIWREIMRSRESRYDHRLHGILFVCRGLSCYETAAIWGSSPRVVEYWVRKFEERGCDGLREGRRPGRPAYMAGPRMSRLNDDLRRAPAEFGHPDSRWTGRALMRHLVQAYGLSLSVRQCQRILKKGLKVSEI